MFINNFLIPSLQDKINAILYNMDLLYSIKTVIDILLESAEVGLYLSETVVAKSKMRA